METAKIFENGRSQAVRLPKKFRLPGNEVVIQRLGHAIMLVMNKGREAEIATVREAL